MKYVKNLLSSIIVIGLIAGCTTVITQQPESPSASFDNGVRNSGFVGWTNYNNVDCGIITSNAVNRYNALIAIYGKRFFPPLTPNTGICTNCIPDLILIQSQDLEHFIRMNRWRLKEAK